MAYTIISIEDDPQIAELFQFVLNHAELSVHFAHDGASGLALIRSMKPDLIMLDVMLPEMGGWDVYDAVRADTALSQTPVIMVSVVTEKPDRKQAFADSAIDRYFTKPFDTRLLRVEVERMLKTTLWGMHDPPPGRSATEPGERIAPPAVDRDGTPPAPPLRPMRSSHPAPPKAPPTDHDAEPPPIHS